MEAWLAYLGSNVEVDLALLGLKKCMERSSIHIDNDQAALNIVIEYFGRAKSGFGQVENMIQTSDGRFVETDLILTFGPHTVAVEATFLGRASPELKTRVEQAATRLARNLLEMQLTRGAVTVFHRGELPPGYDGILSFAKGRISAVVIKIR